MKRLHVHVAVRDLDESIRFYSKLFDAAPVVTKPDYAKWLLEDPRVNFAISARGAAAGVRHLGIQVENTKDLAAVTARLDAAAATLRREEDVSCCYARSDKTWVDDPQGVRWENFFTHDTATSYGFDGREAASQAACGCACAC